MSTLFLGTSNPGKLREYEAILGELGIAFAQVGGPDPDEPAPDLEGNARLKAVAYAARAGGLTVAEDAGLVVPALGGLPGVVSARFADCELDVEAGRVVAYTPSGRERHEQDARNRARLLELLAGRPEGSRRAYFQVAVALARPSGEVLFTASGEAHGRITQAPRGDGGFGYDSLFESDDFVGQTFAELSSAQKNSISHRRRAIDKLKAFLESPAGVAALGGER